MTNDQRFLFDLNGYIVLEKVLDTDRIARMCDTMESQSINDPENDPSKSRFRDFLRWGDDWRNLIDDDVVLPVLREILGPKFRLDSAYGMAMRAGGQAGNFGLHHEAGMFHHGCYYVTHGDRMHNGLVVVSFALTDIGPGMGGFCCIPGSHKALYPMPKKWYGLDDNPHVRQVPQNAGDVVIFTEALTHGTMKWTDPDGERRSVLLKYSPHYHQWDDTVMASDIPDLSPRQALILESPYVKEREAVVEN